MDAMMAVLHRAAQGHGGEQAGANPVVVKWSAASLAQPAESSSQGP